MNTLRTIFHLMRADYLERTRRSSFVATLVLIVFMAYTYVPSSASGYITLSVDGARGLYNSAWIGNLIGILVGITMPGLGFYLVKNVIARDTETGVGQIIATTPLKRPAYMIGKWLSNLAVLAVMLAVTALAAIVLQLALGEDQHIDPVALLQPLVWIILPTLALVSAIALFFETVSWLRGGFGNVVYFFLCTALTMASFMPIMIGLDEPLLDDLLGIGHPLSAMLKATGASFPELDAGNTSIGPVPSFLAGEPLQTFVWAGTTWSSVEILARLRWIIIGFGIVLLAALFFNRFDPSRGRYRGNKKPVVTEPSNPQAKRLSEKPFELNLSALNSSAIRFNFMRVVWAELRLIRKGLPRLWFVVTAGLFIAGVVTSPEVARLYILPVTWLMPILAWSQLGAREMQNRAEGLVFSNAHLLQRQLPAMWLAGILIAMLTGGGVAINLVMNGDITGMVTWTLATLFIPALAIALAIWSGGSKLFEVMYLGIWYFGPVNHLVPPLDFLSTATGTQVFYAVVVIALLAAAFFGRRNQLNK